MGILPRLLLACAAILSAAELKDWKAVKDKVDHALATDPSERSLGALIPQLTNLPSAPRLELARRLAAARPDSDAQAIALADAYKANGMNKEGLATLEAALLSRPDDQNLPALAAGRMSSWGYPNEALSLLSRKIEASSDPERYLLWHALLIQYSRAIADGGPAARLKNECASSTSHGTSEIKPWLLLAQALSSEGDLTALRRLCESGLESFPTERKFYEHLARILRTRSDFPGLAALKRREITSLTRILASDYSELAEALLRAGKHEEARQAMAEGLKDDRLAETEKQKLAERRESLDMLWDEIPTSSPTEAASCAYVDAGRTVSVDCGGKRLAYDFTSKSFSTTGNPNEAARLAGILLERFDQERFAAVKSEKSVLTEETRIRLKAAGYLGP